MFDVIRRQPVLRVSLREDHEIMADFREQIDIARSQIRLQGVIDITNRHAQRLLRL